MPDPGHPEHLPRLADVDPKAADRATRQVAFFFGMVPLLAIGFAVVYFAVPGDWFFDFGPLRANARNLWLGLTFGFSLLFIGIGAVPLAQMLICVDGMVNRCHDATSKPVDHKWMLTELDKVVDESKHTRR